MDNEIVWREVFGEITAIDETDLKPLAHPFAQQTRQFHPADILVCQIDAAIEGSEEKILKRSGCRQASMAPKERYHPPKAMPCSESARIFSSTTS